MILRSVTPFGVIFESTPPNLSDEMAKLVVSYFFYYYLISLIYDWSLRPLDHWFEPPEQGVIQSPLMM